jgi:hypothetical protein
MTLRLNGSTSGYTELDAPAVAGSNTLVLPGGNGSAGNILGTDGAGNLSWVNGRMVLETAKASTSGTFVDFTGIPSWVKRVTVMFSGVSTSGTSVVQVQLGAGAFTTSGYSVAAASSSNATAPTVTQPTTGFPVVADGNAAYARQGLLSITNLTGNAWVASGGGGESAGGRWWQVGGSITLSGTLDRIRITTVNGTDTFDAGSINILYEG